MLQRIAVCVVVACAFVQAQGLKEPQALPPGIAWQPDYDAAIELARAEKRPIMVAFAMVDEPANAQVAKTHFRDPGIIAMSRRFVCLLGHTGKLPVQDGIRFDGSSGKVCSRYGSVTSKEVNRVEMRARTELLTSPHVSTPQFIFLQPDGETVLLRHVWLLPKAELLKKMRLAHAFHDPKEAPAGFQKHLGHVASLLKMARDSHVPRRRGALRSLASIDDPRIVRFLVDQTKPDVDSLRRLEAVFFMGQKGNAKVLSRLHALLRSNDSLTRIYCAVALEAIGMVESAPVVVEVMKKARKDRVRSNLLRCLAACQGDTPVLRKQVIKMLRSSSQLDAVTAAWVATGLEPDVALVKALRKLGRNRNTRKRCAAWYALGGLKVGGALEDLKKVLKSERGQARDFCAWALEQLGEGTYEGDLEPEETVQSWLPDVKLREGELTGI